MTRVSLGQPVSEEYEVAAPVFMASLLCLVAAVLASSLAAEFHNAAHYLTGGLVLAMLWWLFRLQPRIASGTDKPVKIRDVRGRGTTTGVSTPTRR